MSIEKFQCCQTDQVQNGKHYKSRCFQYTIFYKNKTYKNTEAKIRSKNKHI